MGKHSGLFVASNQEYCFWNGINDIVPFIEMETEAEKNFERFFFPHLFVKSKNTDLIEVENSMIITKDWQD